MPFHRKVASSNPEYPKLKGGPGMADDEYIEIEREIGWGARADAESAGRVWKKGVDLKKVPDMTAAERAKNQKWSFGNYMLSLCGSMVRRIHVRVADETRPDGTQRWYDEDGTNIEDVLAELTAEEKGSPDDPSNIMEWLFAQIQIHAGGVQTTDLAVQIEGAGGRKKKATFQETTT